MSLEDELALSRAAARRLARLGPSEKRQALLALGEALERHAARVADASRPGEGSLAQEGRILSRAQVEELAEGFRGVARAPDPVGNLSESTRGPEGLEVARVTVPLGVVALAFEDRPALAAVAVALAVRSSNALVLTGPGAAAPACQALVDVLIERGLACGLPIGFLKRLPELGPSPDLDLVVRHGAPAPSGDAPVLIHEPGPSGLYVDRGADLEVALELLVGTVLASRPPRPRVSRLLLHEEVLEAFVARAADHLREGLLTLHADPMASAALQHHDLAPRPLPPAGAAPPASELAPPLVVRSVASPGEALRLLNAAGPRALDAVATADWSTARRFELECEGVCVALNTVPADAGVDGLPPGFDLGFVTASRHARGPIGARALTTTRLVVRR